MTTDTSAVEALAKRLQHAMSATGWSLNITEIHKILESLAFEGYTITKIKQKTFTPGDGSWDSMQHFARMADIERRLSALEGRLQNIETLDAIRPSPEGLESITNHLLECVKKNERHRCCLQPFAERLAQANDRQAAAQSSASGFTNSELNDRVRKSRAGKYYREELMDGPRIYQCEIDDGVFGYFRYVDPMKKGTYGCRFDELIEVHKVTKTTWEPVDAASPPR